MCDIDIWNLCAIECLEILGVNCPNQTQIDEMEQLLKTLPRILEVPKPYSFNHNTRELCQHVC